MEEKIFTDSIFGSMTFHPVVVVVADTRQVQRLRNVKQLGGCSYVFPSATHTRFEHSLGTAFIAGMLFDNLKLKRIPTGVVDAAHWERQKLCVQIAALCHDIGHGPFSHTWELFKRRVGEEWDHERESVRIFDELLLEEVSPTKRFNGRIFRTVNEVFDFYNLRRPEIDIIKKMIIGQRREKNYLYQIVSNKITEIDVDKWEYITRDSVMLNIPVTFDYKRLLNFAVVAQNELGEEQICFRDKEFPQLVEMFISRAKLHDAAYKHVKVRIVEEMLVDAFELSNERLRLSTTPVTQLTDHIYQKILYDSFGDDQSMRKARDILRRLERRHLYKCLAVETFEGPVPDLRALKRDLGNIHGMAVFMDDLDLTTILIDMTKGNRTKPLKHVCVYKKRRDANFSCQLFDWSIQKDPLKPNLARLRKNQVLLIYKGLLDFPEDLKLIVRDRLKRSLCDRINH